MNPQPFPVTIKTMVKREQGVTIYYPQISDLDNRNLQMSINQTIVEYVQNLISEQYEEQGAEAFTEMIGTFELKTNERNVLSLTLSNYAYAQGYAHGLTLMNSLTFDLTTGKNYELHELFKEESDYVTIISKQIKQQIEDRDIPIINEFTQISPQQYFYIADKALVIYFQRYEITPGYVGLPMFPISVYELQDIAIEEGPLGRMLGQ